MKRKYKQAKITFLHISNRHMENRIFRKPTEEEKHALVTHLASKIGGDIGNDDLETAKMEVKAAYITVFPNYVTDGPGYAGKVMCVVWSGSPNFYEAFIWKTGQMFRLDQASEFRES